MVNNFILNYNPFAGFPSEGQLLGLVRMNRHVLQFYQPFFGTYLLKSADTAYELNESFKAVFESTPYMLTQISASLASGSLPQEAWNWINYGTVPDPYVPPPPTVSGIGSAVTRGLLSGFRETPSTIPPPPPKR